MSGTLGLGGKGPAMAMPMHGGKGMPGMPTSPKPNGMGCRGMPNNMGNGMNQMHGQGMQSMNPIPMLGNGNMGNMGMHQGPSMAQQSLAMHIA